MEQSAVPFVSQDARNYEYQEAIDPSIQAEPQITPPSPDKLRIAVEGCVSLSSLLKNPADGLRGTELFMRYMLPLRNPARRRVGTESIS